MSWGNHLQADAPYVDETDSQAVQDEVQEEGIAIHAGFPNPGTDRRGAALSLDKLLIKHPISTFFFRIQGHRWHDLNVYDGDIAVIDRTLNPHENDLVIWWEETGEMFLGNYRRANQQNIWGVVTSIVHPSRQVQLPDEQ